MVSPTCFSITLPSSGSIPSAFWETLNWGAVDTILWTGMLCLVTWCAHHVTRQHQNFLHCLVYVVWSTVQNPPSLMQYYDSQKLIGHQPIPNLEIFNLDLDKESEVCSSFQPTAWGISISQHLLHTKLSSMNYSQLWDFNPSMDPFTFTMQSEKVHCF
jgi:hypothetical protein